MAGHNQWSKIKHSNGTFDVKRGILPRRLSRDVSSTARDGGRDVAANLRMTPNVVKLQTPSADTIDQTLAQGSSNLNRGNLEQWIYRSYTARASQAAPGVQSNFKKKTGKPAPTNDEHMFEFPSILAGNAGTSTTGLRLDGHHHGQGADSNFDIPNVVMAAAKLRLLP